MSSRSVNKVIIVGHLGKDCDASFTPSGISCIKFSVATSRRFKKGEEWVEETDWINVVLWRSDALAQYLTKGKQVYLEGRMQTRSWDDKDGKKCYMTEVVADQVILLGGGGQKSEDGVVSRPKARPGFGNSQAPKSAEEETLDDDIPF